MSSNPCDSCRIGCPYRLFINCPKWLAWAQAQNQEQEEDDYGEAMGDTEDTDDDPDFQWYSNGD